MKKTSRFNMTMSPDLHVRVVAKAKEMSVPLGRVVRQLLREWLAEKRDVEVEAL